MTWLRHAPRHVHHTAVNYLTDRLDALGWTDDDVTNRPFGGTQVRISDKPAINEDGPVEGVSAGLVAMTLGDQDFPEMLEMGGALANQNYPFFVDCFHDTEETTLALASDVFDIFMGRLDGCQRYLDVVNQITATPVSGWQMEFEDITRVRPDTKIKLHWQVVKVTAETKFLEVIY